MKAIQLRTVSFLKKYGMDYSSISMEEECRRFLKEMEQGLSGTGSSLKMIPTYIENGKKIPLFEPVLVLDLGGTNFRAALIRFTGNRRPLIEGLRKMPVPKGEFSKEEFFSWLAAGIKDILPENKKIGFCFSYPAEILSGKDGRVIGMTKEMKVTGIEGALIGESLVKALGDLGCRQEFRVVVVNDTVSVLLAGETSEEGTNAGGQIGLVLGTGNNTCYVEKNSSISKLKDIDPNKSMVINVESGAYSKAFRGIIDIDYDNGLNDPGNYIFEKMISGKYLGGLVLAAVRTASREGIFSPAFTACLKEVKGLETKDLNDYFDSPVPRNNPLSRCLQLGTGEDHEALLMISDRLIERAALLAAVNISALVIKTGGGVDPGRPVLITAEGTTFYSLNKFPKRLQAHLTGFLTEGRGLYFKLNRIDNAVMVGTAAAGLTN